MGTREMSVIYLQIMVRGRNVMLGYLGDEKKTAQILDTYKWLHTGDIGRIDQV